MHRKGRKAGAETPVLPIALALSVRIASHEIQARPVLLAACQKNVGNGRLRIEGQRPKADHQQGQFRGAGVNLWKGALESDMIRPPPEVNGLGEAMAELAVPQGNFTRRALFS